MSPPNSRQLPRLVYIGEVPIRNISAGPALLFRLLESYPADKLLVLESDHNKADPATELPQVPTQKFSLLTDRLLRSRLARLASVWVYLNAARQGRKTVSRLQAFGAEAILSVTHGYGAHAAAAAANAAGVPLHLLAHDDWAGTLNLPLKLRPRADREFGQLYRNATARMPVSPAMEESYARQYKARGTIIYPSRARDCVKLVRPRLRRPNAGEFVFAYAGSAPSIGQRRTLIDFANTVAPLGVKLRVYQALSMENLRREGLRSDNLEIAAFRPVAELHEDLINRADAMYLPMSFAPEDEANVRLCFPSKLADYTVVGLPILVRSPIFGTATRWAKENPGAALLVTDDDASTLVSAVRTLVEDPERRESLARAALETGEAMFGHAQVSKLFQAQLIAARAHR
ncbi:hypothetical protein [Synoicihabitans lomoniglobus]|uniref:Glycosyltransferase subfamily 4-like N-terminal domain-containing protein n=1 Tax=Synoicihabitans lomoniglobus TaxID=2909285 RepID=A0AAF0CSS8_9BACT|nr:hypothetical protein [Opitutaceae bacterium LMO-M01]WED67331.1 hypothetical protein PXH66_10770 [Opitutaceae bacterium LMO-M01]